MLYHLKLAVPSKFLAPVDKFKPFKRSLWALQECSLRRNFETMGDRETHFLHKISQDIRIISLTWINKIIHNTQQHKNKGGTNNFQKNIQAYSPTLPLRT